MSEYIAVRLRWLVQERARWLCEYCRLREDFSPQPFCFEHIVPKAVGGKTTAENLAYACQGCNAFKATRIEFADEATNATVKLFNPRTAKWSEHFTWSKDSSEIFGVTPEGRATIKALKMNRRGLVNLRRVMFDDGKHPPDED